MKLEKLVRKRYEEDIEKVTEEICVSLKKSFPQDYINYIPNGGYGYPGIGFRENPSVGRKRKVKEGPLVLPGLTVANLYEFEFGLFGKYDPNKRVKYQIELNVWGNKGYGGLNGLDSRNIPLSGRSKYTKTQLEKAKNSTFLKILDYLKVL